MNDTSTSSAGTNTAGPTKPVADADLKPKPMDPDHTASPATPPVDSGTTYTQGKNTQNKAQGNTSSRAGEYASEKAHRAADAAGATGEAVSEEAQRRMDEVRDFTREASDKARQQWTEGREQFEHARRQLAHQWKEQKGAMSEQAKRLADEQRHRMAAGVSDVASAARAAAEELRNRDDATIAGYAEAAADQLDRVRDYMEHADLQADLGGLAHQAADFTRRRPEWVLGGAFVAGLAIARFLKADRPHRRGLPSGADESLYQDAVDQQHARPHASAYRVPRGTVGVGDTASSVRTESDVRTGGSVSTAGGTGDAMPAVPPFGDDAPVGMNEPAPVPPVAPTRGDRL